MSQVENIPIVGSQRNPCIRFRIYIIGKADLELKFDIIIYAAITLSKMNESCFRFLSFSIEN